MSNRTITTTDELLRNWVAAVAMLSVVTVGSFIVMALWR
jgi:hypothetical protein